MVIKKTLDAKYKSKVIPANIVKTIKKVGKFLDKNNINNEPITPKQKIHLRMNDS